MKRRAVYIGFDSRDAASFAVSRNSMKYHMMNRTSIHVYGLVLDELQRAGYYWRKHDVRDGRLWDVISQAPMSTEFAISRFLTPYLAREGWALFVDGDILVRDDIEKLFDCADSRYAVQVVKHNHIPEGPMKMNNQIQTAYGRKNWSSVMLFNCDHPAVKALTPQVVNERRGLDLHQFLWLPTGDPGQLSVSGWGDHLIGQLEPTWNYLVGVSPMNLDPKLVHFTNGVPLMPGCENVQFADEWREMYRLWAL